MVNTKDQSNAIVYGMFVDTVDTGVCGYCVCGYWYSVLGV